MKKNYTHFIICLAFCWGGIAAFGQQSTKLAQLKFLDDNTSYMVFSYADPQQGLLTSNKIQHDFHQDRFDYYFDFAPEVPYSFHGLIHLTGNFQYMKATNKIEYNGQLYDLADFFVSHNGNKTMKINYVDNYDPSSNFRVDYKYDGVGNLTSIVNLDANLDTGDVFVYQHDVQNREISAYRYLKNNGFDLFDSVVYDGNGNVSKLYRGYYSNGGSYFEEIESIFQYNGNFISQVDHTENINGFIRERKEFYSNNGLRYTKIEKFAWTNGMLGAQIEKRNLLGTQTQIQANEWIDYDDGAPNDTTTFIYSYYSPDYLKSLSLYFGNDFYWTIEYVYSQTVGNEEIVKEDFEFVLFPNPTVDHFKVETDATVLGMTLTDLNGRIIREQKGSNSMNIQDLSNGEYLLTVQTNKGSAVKTLFKN